MPAENTSIIVAIIAGTVMLLLLGGFIITFLFFFQKRQQQNRSETQQLQAQFAQTLLQSQLEIKEQTLQHIARELHDNLGQVASLIKINLNTLQLDDPYQAAAQIQDTKALVKQLVNDLKSVSVSLNSDRVAQLGICRGLESEVEKLNRTGRFRAMLQTEGDLPMLDGNATVIVFRMVQEILNNAVKHSEAKQIVISLQARENSLTLVCSDDGVGFDVQEKLKSGGSGLINLRSRASLINAQLVIESTRGSGTSIAVKVPL